MLSTCCAVLCCAVLCCERSPTMNAVHYTTLQYCGHTLHYAARSCINTVYYSMHTIHCIAGAPHTTPHHITSQAGFGFSTSQVVYSTSCFVLLDLLFGWQRWQRKGPLRICYRQTLWRLTNTNPNASSAALMTSLGWWWRWWWAPWFACSGLVREALKDETERNMATYEYTQTDTQVYSTSRTQTDSQTVCAYERTYCNVRCTRIDTGTVYYVHHDSVAGSSAHGIATTSYGSK